MSDLQRLLQRLDETGIEFVLNPHWRIEPHYLRQEDSRSEPKHTNAFGLVLKYYR